MPAPFRLFLEDLQEPERCDAVLEAVADARTGRREILFAGTRVAWMRLVPTGTSFLDVSRQEPDPDEALSLDMVEDGLSWMRRTLTDRPPARPR